MCFKFNIIHEIVLVNFSNNSIHVCRVGFLPGRKVFLPSPGEKLGRNWGERVSAGQKGEKLGRKRGETHLMTLYYIISVETYIKQQWQL
jgi:hypothetical protein